MSRFTNHIHRTGILVALTLLFSSFSLVVQAQEPVVYGVFFYAPTCPHCHDVIDNHWPDIQDEFGDQVQVLFIDASTNQGGQIMGSALQAMQIASNGVPMLILGTDVMVGSYDIPQRAPTIIRAGLDDGGIGYPPIPNIDQVFESVGITASQSVTRPDFSDDPANFLALIVLVGLVGSLVLITPIVWRITHPTGRTRRKNRTIRPSAWILRIGAIIGLILSGSLAIGSLNDGLTLTLSSVVLVIFAVLAFNSFKEPSFIQITHRATPLVIFAGLLVAGYLAYVETTLTTATCGVVGNCNTVQQSPYAQLAGIPIGVIGVIGYVIILLVWAFDRYRPETTATWVLFGLALSGVVFSTYLTFLEPFVIGATCVWCLISAVVMTILLWLSLPIKQATNTANR